MKEYFISIIAIALVGSLIISMLPSSSNAKYLRFICGLCAIGCIVFPLINADEMMIDFESLKELFYNEQDNDNDYEKIYNDAMAKAEISNAEISLKNEIVKAYSANHEDFDIEITTKKYSDDFYISKITLKIYPSGITLNVHLIKKYIEEQLGHECVIFYEAK